MSNEKTYSPKRPEDVQHPFTHPPYAFPLHAVVQTPGGTANITSAGMTLRDYFAGQALAGMLACPDTADACELVAQASYNYADAMLKAREGK